MLLEINDLHASVDEQAILKGLNLKINKGEIHAIMGPNGSGKSTLSKVLVGHPSYDVTSGTVNFEQDDLLELDASERAHKGLFLSFQYPVEIPGVNNIEFLRLSYNSLRESRGEDEISAEDFQALVQSKMDLLGLHNEIYTQRCVNDGFSGGEKKKNEILQMAILEPKLAILDEIDSGLDIDALKLVAEGINELANENKALLLITHYQRLLDYIKPTHVHIMNNGRITKSGGPELALQLETQGYVNLIK